MIDKTEIDRLRARNKNALLRHMRPFIECSELGRILDALEDAQTATRTAYEAGLEDARIEVGKGGAAYQIYARVCAMKGKP